MRHLRDFGESGPKDWHFLAPESALAGSDDFLKGNNALTNQPWFWAGNIDDGRLDSLRSRATSAAVFLASETGGKVMLLAAMTPDVVKRGVKAGDLIKAVAPIVGGKGGGRPDMAQGGGTDAGKIPDAVKAARAWLREFLDR